ncbi:hypothetical protein BDV39DRAFT_179795 [Aspergillus sergii]|uniref:Uncharacterized protein n=1 Tax=Aspergillus sergii TaxID=1034303 RepID=A0A5N6WVI7_9EURO|nr:hypothetical protein BDV39DRAFT_179795 [Aspergillus sergii]
MPFFRFVVWGAIGALILCLMAWLEAGRYCWMRFGDQSTMAEIRCYRLIGYSVCCFSLPSTDWAVAWGQSVSTHHQSRYDMQSSPVYNSSS